MLVSDVPLALLATFLGGFFVIGLISGRVLEDMVYRLPKLNASRRDGDHHALAPRAHCRACMAPLPGWQRLPVLAYLKRKGQCPSCAAPAAPRRPVIEIGTGVLMLAAAWLLGPTWPLVGVTIFLWFAIPLALIDVDTHQLPEDLTLGLLWAGLLTNVAEVFATTGSAVAGAAAGYIFMRGIAETFRRATGKEGLGGGDAKLFAAMGAWLGWQGLPLVALIACVSALFAIGILALGAMRRPGALVPFGPFLLAGGFVTLFWGQDIWRFLDVLASF